jgi:uncharacterized membrane protein (DUF485 family)
MAEKKEKNCFQFSDLQPMFFLEKMGFLKFYFSFRFPIAFARTFYQNKISQKEQEISFPISILLLSMHDSYLNV